MKKFFLFRREELSLSSVTASDTGAGVSIFAVPADSLAFASASRGLVKLTFNDASIYEESNLTDGESIEKTTVTIPCEEGREFELVETILANIGREGGRTVMHFDAVNTQATFSSASFDDRISSKVSINPVKRITGLPSTQTFIGSSGTVGADVKSNVIADIDFGIAENLPVIDYNHEDLEGNTVGGQVNSWANAGTGGNTYNIGANVGTPTYQSAKSGISTFTAELTAADHFVVPTYTHSGAYVVYAAYRQSNNEAHPLYGDVAGECFGFTAGQTKFSSTGVLDKIRPSVYMNLSVRHAGLYGAPAYSELSEKYPNLDIDNPENLLVFVVRRDDVGNMFMYDRHGDLVATIDAKTHHTLSDARVKYTNATDGRTDGDLEIECLGTVKSLTTDSFVGNIARFGVIDRDPGSAFCSKLAQDLFKFYND